MHVPRFLSVAIAAVLPLAKLAAQDPAPPPATPAAEASSKPANVPHFRAILISSTKEIRGSQVCVIDSAKGTLEVLKEINPGNSPNARGGVVSGNQLYFWAEDRDTGFRIWKTDGTTESTVPLELDYEALRKIGGGTLFPADDGFFIAGLRHVSRYTNKTGKLTNVMDPKLRFVNFLETDGSLLVQTQGTGFQKPSWIYAVSQSTGKPVQLVESRESLRGIVGAMRLGTHWLYAEPGYFLGDLQKPTSNNFTSLVNELTILGRGVVLGKKLIFTGHERFKRPDGKMISKYGDELYESDGTPAGTKLLKDILDTPGDSIGAGPRQLTLCGDKAVFTVAKARPREMVLWESDGTAEGTKPITKLPDGTSVNDIISIGKGTAFTASTAGRGWDLWWTDGTSAGTRLVLNGNFKSRGLQKSGDGVVLYVDSGGKSGLWWSDGGSAQFIAPISQGNSLMQSYPLQDPELFGLLPVKP